MGRSALLLSRNAKENFYKIYSRPLLYEIATRSQFLRNHDTPQQCYDNCPHKQIYTKYEEKATQELAFLQIKVLRKNLSNW